MSHRTPTRAGEFCGDYDGIGQCLASREFFEGVLVAKAEKIKTRAEALSPRSKRRLKEPRPRYHESFKIHAGERRDASGKRFVVTVYNDNPHQHPYYVETGNVNIDTYAPLRRALGESVLKERRPGNPRGTTQMRVIRRADR